MKSENRSVVSDPLRPHELYNLWNSPGQNTGVGSRSLLQGIVPTQGSNPSLPHCKRILYPREALKPFILFYFILLSTFYLQCLLFCYLLLVLLRLAIGLWPVQSPEERTNFQTPRKNTTVSPFLLKWKVREKTQEIR